MQLMQVQASNTNVAHGLPVLWHIKMSTKCGQETYKRFSINWMHKYLLKKY